MFKLRLFMVALVLLSAGCAGIQKFDSARVGSFAELGAFKKNERILILAPHPDDAEIHAGGLIAAAPCPFGFAPVFRAAGAVHGRSRGKTCGPLSNM